MKVILPLKCPEDAKHNIFKANVKIVGTIKSDRYGCFLDLTIGRNLVVTEYEPDICAVCKTPLIGGATWHKQETEEALRDRIIVERGLDEEEIEEFNIEDYRCGLCSRLYDKCDCAQTGMR